MRNFNRSLGLVSAVVLLFGAQAVWSADMVSLKERLVAARKKLDASAKVQPKKEPTAIPQTEFGSLFDETYEALEKECKELLGQRKVGEAYRRRMIEFVQVAALSVHLEPGQSTAEITLKLQKSKFATQRAAFKAAVDKLEPVLKADLLNALRLEEQSQREGNG